MSDRRQARAEAAHPEGLGDSRAEAQGRDGRTAEARSARQEALVRPAHGLRDEVMEHRTAVVAPVVAPSPFVQVTLKPLVRDGMVSTAHAGFEQAEEPVDGLCVN